MVVLGEAGGNHKQVHLRQQRRRRRLADLFFFQRIFPSGGLRRPTQFRTTAEHDRVPVLKPTRRPTNARLLKDGQLDAPGELCTVPPLGSGKKTIWGDLPKLSWKKGNRPRLNWLGVSLLKHTHTLIWSCSPLEIY